MRRSGARSADERTLRATAWRIGVQTAAGVALTVLVLAAIGVGVVLHAQHRAQDDLINSAITRADDDVSDPPDGVWLAAQTGDTVITSPGMPSGLPDRDQLRRTVADRVTRSEDVRVGGHEYRVRTAVAGDRVIQAVLDLAGDHAQRTDLVMAFLVSGAVGLLLAAAAGTWLARRAVAPLAHALALQRRFVADASHELRTPLTLISTRAQLIRRSLGQVADPAALRPEVDRLVRDTRQLADILDDLLVAAAPDPQPAEPVDLAALLRDVVDAARPLADQHAVTLTLTTDPGGDPGGGGTVPGSAAALRRAVTALLDNAVRHARGQVRVTLGEWGGDAVVDVADDGPGIAPDRLPTLFTRFATTPADGAVGARRRYGLGLSLVNEVAARHGGSIAVADTGAGGATFRLRLPGYRRGSGAGADSGSPGNSQNSSTR